MTSKTLKLPKGIRQRDNGSFLIDVTVAGVRQTRVAHTLDAAMDERAKMISQGNIVALNGGNSSLAIVKNGGWTLQEAYSRANSVFWIGKRSEKTNFINCTAAMKFFGENKLMCTFTQEDIDLYREHLIEHRNANATINRKMSALARMLQIAEEHGHIGKLPKMRRQKEPQGRIRVLSPSEEVILFDQFSRLNTQEHVEALTVLRDMAFRPSEFWSLTASQVNLSTNLITIWYNKTDTPRSVPMTTRVRDIIMARCDAFPTGKLFPHAGKAWMRTAWNKVRHKMGMDGDADFIPYMLRHTCCTEWVEAGIPLAKVMKMMGHSDMKTTMRYSHLSTESLEAPQQKVESKRLLALQRARNEQATEQQQQSDTEALEHLLLILQSNPNALNLLVKNLSATSVQPVAK